MNLKHLYKQSLRAALSIPNINNRLFCIRKIKKDYRKYKEQPNIQLAIESYEQICRIKTISQPYYNYSYHTKVTELLHVKNHRNY